jgi:hypothetical protein
MESIALRPRKATEIVDAAIEVYRRNPVHFMLLTAMVHAPWLILQLVLLGNTQPATLAVGDITTSILISLGTVVSLFLMSAVVVQMASELYLGRETDAFEAIRRVGWKIPTAFVASLIQGLLFVFGMMLLLVPAVYWSALYFAAIPVIVLERRSLFAAFERSGQLSKDLKLHILSTLGLVLIIRWAITGGALFLVLIIPSPVAQRVVSALVSIVVYPLAGITDALLYYDARIRREGFDIEMMAATSVTPKPAAAAV